MELNVPSPSQLNPLAWVKKDEFLAECSDLDDILVIRGDGVLMVTKVGEKKYVGKDVKFITIYRKTDPERIFNLIYQDGRGGNVMVKRFTVGGTTRDKEYVLTKGNEGSKVLYLSNCLHEKEGEKVRVMLRPKPKLRITQLDVDFNEFEVKGRGTIGNILTKNSAQKVVKLSDAPSVSKTEQLMIEVSPSTAKKSEPVKAVATAKKPAAIPSKPAPKSKKSKAVKNKSSKPIKEEKAVTVEWDFKKSGGKEEKGKKKSQMKMDL